MYRILLYALFIFFFFFNDTATTEIYTLSLHDALPICKHRGRDFVEISVLTGAGNDGAAVARSEEHTSELQSHLNLVCRLLLEKKKEVAGHDGAAVARSEEHTSELQSHLHLVCRLLLEE